MMASKNIILYSWRNNTTNISYILEVHSLLLEQQKNGDVCTCIDNNKPLSFSKKYLL